MNESPTTTPSSSRSLGRMIVAVLILAVAAWVLLHIVIGIVTFLAVPVIAVAAIVAIVWAVRILF
jgi:hypothetical protein